MAAARVRPASMSEGKCTPHTTRLSPDSRPSASSALPRAGAASLSVSAQAHTVIACPDG